ncbi:MAG: hypothetical protein ACYDCU_02720 [Candidatus Acidiferrales bacterium]
MFRSTSWCYNPANLGACWAGLFSGGMLALSGMEDSMDTPSGTFLFFPIACAVVLGAWFCLIIYRSTLEAHEDDQIFLDAAEDSMAQAQRELVARIERVNPVIRAVMIAWIVLAAISAGLWMWQAFKSF